MRLDHLLSREASSCSTHHLSVVSRREAFPGRVCSSVGQSTRLISVGSMVQIHPDPPLTDSGVGGRQRREGHGGHSSAGRAPALQAGGHRFDPGWLHQHWKRAKQSEDRVFVPLWLLHEAPDRLIFKNSGIMKVVCWRRGGAVWLPCASTHWVMYCIVCLPY